MSNQHAGIRVHAGSHDPDEVDAFNAPPSLPSSCSDFVSPPPHLASSRHLEKSETLANLNDALIVGTGLIGRRLDASRQGLTTESMGMRDG